MNVDRLIESFLKFPGIGPRQARRFVYFLAGEDKAYVDNLAKLILEVKSGMKQCESCYRYFNFSKSRVDQGFFLRVGWFGCFFICISAIFFLSVSGLYLSSL